MTARAITASSATTLVWLGSAMPARSIRWLDGALAAAAALGDAIAVAAGEPAWLDLAADRASRAGLASAGVPTELALDYVGWAQVVAAVARQIRARTILVEEVGRPAREIEVGAIAELVEAPQLTRVIALATVPDDDGGPCVRATRLGADGGVQTVRVRGPAVIGVRIAGPAIDEYPTPTPSAAMKRLDLAAIGLDPIVLAHRTLPARTSVPARKSLERVVELIASSVALRGPSA